MINYNYHIFFKVCRPIKYKYHLAVNPVIVLNGSYCYMTAINKPFTITDLLRFTHYYAHNRMKQYIFILVKLGYIILSGLSKRKQPTYIISEKGIEVIKELNESYERELYLFCSAHGIEL